MNRARRHDTVYSLNGHQPDLRGEPLRKAVSDNVSDARALLSKSVKSSLSREDIDAAFANITESIRVAGGLAE